MTDTASKVCAAVAEKLRVDASRVVPDARFVDDLGADSLGVIDVIMAVEDACEVVILDSEEEAIVDGTVGGLIALVDAKQKAVAA